MSLFWWECLCCKEIKSVEIATNYINVFLTKIFFGLDKILCLKVFQSSYLHQTTNSQTTRSTVCCSTAHQSSRLSSCLEKLVGLSGLFFFGIRKIFLCFEPTWKSLVFKQAPKFMVCVVMTSCFIMENIIWCVVASETRPIYVFYRVNTAEWEEDNNVCINGIFVS